MATKQDDQATQANGQSVGGARVSKPRKPVLNKVEEARVALLAFKRTEFVKAVTAADPALAISTETLKKVERENKGSPATRAKILQGFNKILASRGQAAVTADFLFPPPPSTPTAMGQGTA